MYHVCHLGALMAAVFQSSGNVMEILSVLMDWMSGTNFAVRIFKHITMDVMGSVMFCRGQRKVHQ